MATDRDAAEPGDSNVAGAADLAEIQVPTGAKMHDLGWRLAHLLRPGDLVVLTGPLGAGKTTLVQGIGQGLGVRGPVTSPTFVIARVHPSLRGGPALVHADAYRLGSRAEVDDLDLDADLDSSVTVVEWGEGLVEDLSPSFLEVKITVVRRAGRSGRPGEADTSGSDAEAGTSGSDAEAGTSGSDAEAGTSGTDTEADTSGTVIAEVPEEPRIVRLAGTGVRWTAAAQSARGALADWPDRPPDRARARL